jgi:alpha-tubulin suppressor-like RCC1 family protein
VLGWRKNVYRPLAILASCLFLLSCKGLKAYSESDAGDDTGDGDTTEADSLDSTDADDGLGCTGDGDCADGDPCNGEETCNLATHACEPGTPHDDGFVCGADPRRICLDEECRESVCGDGFVDTGGGESCEPPSVGSCTDDCVLSCESDLDCADDGNVCNGDEFCDLSVNECDHRDPLEDGTICGTSPRRICLSGSCQDSICGDGFTDVGASPSEECDDLNTVTGDGCDNDCTYSCHNDLECDDGRGCTRDMCDTTTAHTCSYSTLGPSITCRATAGDCDVQESCNGVDPDCPADGFLGSSTLCRAAVDDCDEDELCTGSTATCPADSFAPPGTTCNDGDPCTESDECDGSGVCAGTPVTGCCDVESIQLAGHATCAVMSEGNVYCWGDNRSGECGNGTITLYETSPVGVVGLSSVVEQLDMGSDHACALVGTGALKCWGNNDEGALGDGTTFDSPTPVDVIGLASTATKVAGGTRFSCALLSTGGVQCWGWNFFGTLGDGTTTSRRSPGYVSGLTSGAIDICAANYHACALMSSGGVRCWGQNDFGNLGDGTTTDSFVPVSVTGLSTTAIAIDCTMAHTCVLLSTGGIQCWGLNNHGQIGDGTTSNKLTAIAVPGLASGVNEVSAGWYHTCALLSTGGLKCWGDGSEGQLGLGTTAEHRTPADVPTLSSGVTSVDCSGNHSCAILTGGELKCWGSNFYGQVGIGSTVSPQTSPVDVTIPCT